MSRRKTLGSLGSLVTAGSVSFAGCIGDTESETETTSTSTPTPTETATSTPSQLPSDDSFATLAPDPEVFGLEESYLLTSTQPTVAVANADAFGDSGGSFRDMWIRTPRETSLSDTVLNVWIDSVMCVVGDIDREQRVSTFEAFQMEAVGEHRGFDLYEGTVNGLSKQVIAVGDEALLFETLAGENPGRERLEHLIDVRDGVTPGYLDVNSEADRVASLLPQGVFTRLYDGVNHFDGLLGSYDVATGGESIVFERERQPATGVTVLNFEEGVRSPRDATARILSEASSFGRVPLTEPTITTVTDQTAVIESTVDPEVVFG